MKTCRRIWILTAIVGFITALSLIDRIDVTYKDLWTSFVIIALIMTQVILQALYDEKQP